MNNFLFITHITPKAKRSVFRQSLIDIYFKALNNQSYSKWKVIVLGEEERVEGKFNWFSLPDSDHETRFREIAGLFQRTEIIQLIDEADYVIKLDDDDIISPVLLEQLKTFNGDLYYDAYHTFIDSSSGTITQQERPWVASTCVHRKACIFSEWKKEGASPVGNLLYSDHSKSWHLYYSDKKKQAANRQSPVYLRVLSPTSITSGVKQDTSSGIAGISMEEYYRYLSSFGKWENAPVRVFDDYLSAIREAWKKFSGDDWIAIRKQRQITGFLKRLGL